MINVINALLCAVKNNWHCSKVVQQNNNNKKNTYFAETVYDMIMIYHP